MPVVDPEVLMDGRHGLARCGEITIDVLHRVLHQPHRQGVPLEARVLKPNTVLPGLSSAQQAFPNEVAEAALIWLRCAVPTAMAGVIFLSGGQEPQLATRRLNATHLQTPSPWPLSFSLGRALRQPALGLWASKDANISAAHRAMLRRARCNAAAARGA